MLYLSEILMRSQQDLNSFEDLVKEVKKVAGASNERFFRMDIKPQFGDTPDNWEDRLEAAFY